MRSSIGVFLLLVLMIVIGGYLAAKLWSEPPAAPTAVLPTLAPTPTQEMVVPVKVEPTVVPAAKPAAEVKPLATAKADAVVRVIVTAVPGLNIRSKPGGAIVGSVKTGAVLAVKNAGEWAQIANGEYQGKYVATKFLRAK